jgi:hypothetical protein
VRGTHQLSNAERLGRQDSEIKSVSKGHSRPVRRRVRELSGLRIKPKRGHSLSVERRARESSGQRIKPERGYSLSVERRARGASGQRNKARARCTHDLWATEGVTNQDSRRKLASNRNTPSVERRGCQNSGLLRKSIKRRHSRSVGCGRDMSGKLKKASSRGALTLCRV